MAVTYRDLSNLNSSFDNLGNTLMQNRMMAERKSERAQDRTDRLSENATSRADRLAEQSKMDEYRQELLKQRMEANQNTKDAGAAKIAEQLKAHAEASLEKTFETISKGVADGTIKPETGNAMLKAAVGKVPETLKNNPVVQMISDPSFSLVDPGTTKIEPLQKTFGDTSVIYNPATGAFHVEGGTKAKDTTATVDWPIGPATDTGAQAGRIKGLVTDPSVRAMMGTNAPPMPTVQPPPMPGQPAAPAARVRKYNPATGMIE